MIAHRTGVLVGLLALAVLTLVIRLAWIQVGEHETWVEEADRLLHSGTVLPYRRGAILDDHGRPLAVDAQAYHLVVVYRELRREHPLGQATHALAAVLGRPVPLPDVAPELEAWTDALVQLSPTAVRTFAEGGSLVVGGLRVPPCEDPQAERRARRADDLAFYIARLVDPERDHRRTLDRARRSREPQPSYAALVAANSLGVDAEAVRAGVRRRAREALEALALLARELSGSLALAEAPSSGSPVESEPGASDLARLLEALDARRREVEDRAAAQLASEVLGFAPGRVELATLLAEVDLSFLQRLLAWDEARLEGWAAERRVAWLGWRDGFALPYLLADLDGRPREEWTPDHVLSLIGGLFAVEEGWQAALDGVPIDWRELRELTVLARLPALFSSRPPRGLDVGAWRPLPIQDEGLRAAVEEGETRWSLLDRAATLPPGPPPWPGATWGGLDDGLPGPRAVRAVALGLVDAWEQLFQDAVAVALSELRAAAPPETLSADGRLRIDPGWLDQVEARLRFLVIDHGSRPHVLESRPSFEAVHLLTRLAPRFGGLTAVDARERVQVVLDGEPGLPGAQLVGAVLGADPEDLRHQRADLARLAVLRRDPERTPAEDEELARLLEGVRLADEARGVSGLEAHWDEELRGKNGFREAQGLEDLYGRGRWVSIREPIDGRELTLTLRADVQLACEQALWGAAPPDDPDRDDDWYGFPVGAVVLATIDGDVVAAASSPPPWAEVPPGLPPALSPVERTLGKPDFQPPGSVFKPFVAAWALSHEAGFDPDALVEGEELPDGRIGYGGVRCWAQWCHGPVDLHDAIVGSCNAYFARLGEGLSVLEFAALADAFGFGEPTGVRQHADRGGLREEDIDQLFSRPLDERSLRRAGNGLSVVEATPGQIARGFLGLATGRLPYLRLVRAVGDEPLPRRPPEEIDVRPAHLARVRAAMVDVAALPAGTAHRALSEEVLGFRVAVKTGSADLVGRREGDTRGRKHTWVAGWAPAEDPRVVFVVFVHDTTATSSHGAAYVTRDILGDPTVRAWLAERGVLP